MTRMNMKMRPNTEGVKIAKYKKLQEAGKPTRGSIAVGEETITYQIHISIHHSNPI